MWSDSICYMIIFLILHDVSDIYSKSCCPFNIQTPFKKSQIRSNSKLTHLKVK